MLGLGGRTNVPTFFGGSVLFVSFGAIGLSHILAGLFVGVCTSNCSMASTFGGRFAVGSLGRVLTRLRGRGRMVNTASGPRNMRS